MASMHVTRVKREFREIISSEEVSRNAPTEALYFLLQAKKATIKVEILDESDVTHLRGTVIGPPDTPFEG